MSAPTRMQRIGLTQQRQGFFTPEEIGILNSFGTLKNDTIRGLVLGALQLLLADGVDTAKLTNTSEVTAAVLKASGFKSERDKMIFDYTDIVKSLTYTNCEVKNETLE